MNSERHFPHPPGDSLSETQWRSWLSAVTGALLLYEGLTGLAIYLLPFSVFSQLSVVLHTIIGLVSLLPVGWYVAHHWWLRRRGNLSHFQLIGYFALGLLGMSMASGLVVTWQGVFGPRMERLWDVTHLLSSIGLMVLVVVHLATAIVKKTGGTETGHRIRSARRSYYLRSSLGCLVLLGAGGVWVVSYSERESKVSFPDHYDWSFGNDRPFAPSLARVKNGAWTDTTVLEVMDILGKDHNDRFREAVASRSGESTGLFNRVREYMDKEDVAPAVKRRVESVLSDAAEVVQQRGALAASALAGSRSCGTTGCHEQIYSEWLPSAHRYASMDDMFQRVQAMMAQETSPAHTRYCAGCHDPISLFSGAKNSANITLSALGADEGISCLVCHCIVQTDVQGNGDYTIEAPQRYVYETKSGSLAKCLSDFLIRTYPRHHVTSYSRSLYKTPEFCGACHKQYLDKEVNTDIGKVQGQNQYDSWKNSRWHHPDDPERNISCRECHMPLQQSHDPARGDATDYNRSLADRRHRSHRTLAGNQYIPAIHKLEGFEEHVALTEQWLQGKIEIPEIAGKWSDGPVVTMDIRSPDRVAAGDELSFQVVLTNNKTGHDFPTGPLDMIESWIEVIVEDDTGRVLHHSGRLNAEGKVTDPEIWYKADGFDRRRELIDRHNLWDLVGASYKRSLYPGVTDSASVQLQCPSMARKRVTSTHSDAHGQRSQQYALPDVPWDVKELLITSILWYRKANPKFLDRVYGVDSAIRSPVTELTRATTRIGIVNEHSAP